ncbi:DUF350 domain-containing protein [Brevibacterium litoralis]|uniref:DUF350 domain-containing protein n=1 Tax=Brevibacterium litoralis TaxID=3138935 RepID=UPI0032EF81B6
MFLALLVECGIVLAYAAAGLILMLVGYGVVDLLTPGKLHELLWGEKSKNAVALVSSNLFGVAIIAATAIRASADDFMWGIISTVVYGVIGILIMALSFLVIDWMTPAPIAEMVHLDTLHPAIFVNVSAHLGIAVVMASALF